MYFTIIGWKETRTLSIGTDMNEKVVDTWYEEFRLDFEKAAGAN